MTKADLSSHGEPPPTSRIVSALAGMHPAYFALVMATGIVSIAAELHGWRGVSLSLLGLNVVCYTVLWVLTLLRAVMFYPQMKADLLHHGRCVGFFTMIAGTNVLGSQFLLVYPQPAVASGLAVVGGLLWAVLTYGLFAVLTVKQIKPTLDVGINGGWLVTVVATQSVAVISCQLAGQFGDAAEPLRLFSLTMWFGGAMLYGWIISLIFYRYMFFTLQPSDLAPPYWINMGAMAISTLAGTMLIQHAPNSAVLVELLPFLKGLTLLFWATATWWIPMLVILGIWRHGVRRFPLQYDPLYWGAVFPLGMYTVCTYRLANSVSAPYLTELSRVFIWVAATAWLVTFIGMFAWLLRLLFYRASGSPAFVSGSRKVKPN